MAQRGSAKLGPTIVIAALLCGLIGAATAFAEDVPLPTPAPLPKTGAAPAPTNSVPAATSGLPGFFPFSASSDKSSSASAAPSGSSSPATAFDDKQRALLDRISKYLSSIQTMEGNFVQIGPDGGRTQGTFYLQKPGRVRFEYNPPSPIDIISDGSSVVVRDRNLATQDSIRCRKRRCATCSPSASTCSATPTWSASRPTTVSPPSSSSRSN